MKFTAERSSSLSNKHLMPKRRSNMSHGDKPKMSFARTQSIDEEEEDLLNREVDEIAQSSADLPIRRLRNVKKIQEEEEEENLEEAEFGTDAKQTDEKLKEKPPLILDDQVAPKIVLPREEKISENSDELSYRELLFNHQRRNLQKHSLSPFDGSNFTLNDGHNLNDDVDLLQEHTAHELFIQLNELYSYEGLQEWRETARWIKYEENVEEGADRWGRPHVSSLSFHSLINIRRFLETGVVMFDMKEKCLPEIVHRAIDTMFAEDVIRDKDREKIFNTIFLQRAFDDTHSLIGFDIRNRRSSSQSLKRNFSSDGSRSSLKLAKRKSLDAFRRISRRGSNAVFQPPTANFFNPPQLGKDDEEKQDGNEVKLTIGPSEEQPTAPQDKQQYQNESLLKRLPVKCEGAAVLTGIANFLEQPTIAFIRLTKAVKIANILEVAIPIRFIVIFLGPKIEDLNYHEKGRSISTLLCNKHFRHKAYNANNRKDLMSAINEFLDESIVLPPGKIDKETLLPLEELKEKAEMIRMRKRRARFDQYKTHHITEDQLMFLSEKFDAGQKKPDGPLKKTGRLWGGLVDDLKRRLPMLKSDVVDGLNNETLAATVFLYFACFATAITFGGLVGDVTKGNIGISETLLATCFVGIVFHIFCGQPLVIVGTTGPFILFDKALYEFCLSKSLDFLNVRVFVGVWMMIISLIVSAFEGSTYVRFFTRFTQEIFSALITLIYLYSTFNKTIAVYFKNPLMDIEDYATTYNTTEDVMKKSMVNQPNTALFCTLMTLGTFMLAYNLKIFRNSHFLGRTSRRALGDFGVPISIAIFVVIANISQVRTEKLRVPDGIEPTLPRPWLAPLWKDENPIWLPLACIVPGFLVYILAFMETHISELILDKPERKLKKGSGFHWDIVLLCILNVGCGLFGMPWHCAAAVRSVAHISAVTVMSTNHPPGESPHIVEIKEQKLSGFFVSLLIGLSIFAAPLLKKIPISVLFGVFLYMGICSMNGVQLFERIILFFIPVKYHTGVYASKVFTLRMHVYTAIQVTALAILWIVNESSMSLAFPFFLIMMVPLRRALGHFYSLSELEALDGAQQNDSDDIEDDDFYEQTNLPA